MDEIVLKSSKLKTTQIEQFENGLKSFLEARGLPNENIFVGVEERMKVFRNIDDVLDELDPALKLKSMYLSKFIAATAGGLFDAALNYLWDETVLQLRERVIQYDVDYFYDNAVGGDKRKKFKDESDLLKLDDEELIRGAREIELISDLGYKHLDFIKFMRNWASAAHPNHSEITGLQLISWLETCIKEVISLPISQIAVRIKRILYGIKKSEMPTEHAEEVGRFLVDLNQDQVNTLVSGFFGIYVKIETEVHSLQNIRALLPFIWERVDEDIKYSFGIKHAQFTINNLPHEKKMSREFLEFVGGESYIPDDLRVPEIETALSNLLSAHRGHNNFYSEGTFAKELKRIVGNKVPKAINKKYVLDVVLLYLSNGYGVAWAADEIYSDLIRQFDSHQATIAITSFYYPSISSRLQFSLCQKQFRQLIGDLKKKITSPVVIELVEKIEKYKGRLDGLRDDPQIKLSLRNLKIIIDK